jgi:hypothetical protein
MHIQTESIAMFLHIGLVVVGMMLGAVLHSALLLIRRSETTTQMRPWVPVIRRVEPLMPFIALTVLLTGAWLLHLSGGEFSWTDGWVLTSVVGLVVAEAVGGSLAPRSHALTAAIENSTDGPVTTDLRRRALDPRLFCGSHFVTAEFFAIIFLMSAQPTAVWSCIILVVAGTVGVLTGLPFTRQPRQSRSAPEPVTQ